MDEACKCKMLRELFGRLILERLPGTAKKSIEEIDFFFYAPIDNRNKPTATVAKWNLTYCIRAILPSAVSQKETTHPPDISRNNEC